MIDRLLRGSSPLFPVAVALLYWVAAASSLRLTGGTDGVASVWPASGVLLAATIHARGRVRAAVLLAAGLASLIANMGAGFGPDVSAGFTSANVVEAIIGGSVWAALSDGRRTLSSWADVISLVAAVTAAALVSSLVAFVVTGEPSFSFVLSWFCTVALGMLVVAPAAMTNDRFLTDMSIGTPTLSSAAWLALLFVISVGSFVQIGYPLLFLPLAALLGITWHLGVRGAAMGLLVISLVGAVCTDMGRGPVALMQQDVTVRSLFFQAYLLTLFVTALPIAVLNSSRTMLARQLAQAVDTAEAAAAHSLALAEQDHLTGVASRRRIMADLASACDEAALVGTPFSIIAVDIDHFKSVNDRYGHEAGDHVLVAFAQAVQAAMGSSDLLGRIGGEEFVVITHQGVDDAVAMAAQLRERTKLSPITTDALVRVTASYGVAGHRTGEEARDLLRRADAALYAAKSAGRDTIRLAS